jgi:hypothetical protein
MIHVDDSNMIPSIVFDRFMHSERSVRQASFSRALKRFLKVLLESKSFSYIRNFSSKLTL